MRKWLGRLALVLAPLALTFGLAEVVLRREVPPPGITPFRTGTIEGLSHQLRPGFTTLYKGVEVHINALGFRGPEPAAEKAGRRRVALIGDSVTFGNAIELERTIGYLLQRELDAAGVPAEVLNFGVPGYSAPNVATVLREQVLDHRPDDVVYLFVANDVAPSRRREEIPPDAVIDEAEKFPLRSACLQWVGVRVKAFLRARGLSSDRGWVAELLATSGRGGHHRVLRALKEMAALCARSQTRFLVASVPFMVRPTANPLRAVDEAVEQDCAELGIPFEALVGVFDPDEDLTAYWATVFDPHPDGEANRRMAERLAARLMEESPGAR